MNKAVLALLAAFAAITSGPGHAADAPGLTERMREALNYYRAELKKSKAAIDYLNAAGLDRDKIFFTGLPRPIRDYELNLALVYQAQIVPGWTLQPAFHYVFHPGGHIPDPSSPVPGAAIKDAAVFALRSVIVY